MLLTQFLQRLCLYGRFSPTLAPVFQEMSPQEELLQLQSNVELKARLSQGYQQLWLQKEVPELYLGVWDVYRYRASDEETQPGAISQTQRSASASDLDRANIDRLVRLHLGELSSSSNQNGGPDARKPQGGPNGLPLEKQWCIRSFYCSLPRMRIMEVHNSLVFLEPVFKHSARFIWLSRRTGFSHLYLIDAVLSRQAEEVPNQTAWVSENLDIVQEVQLTSGEWDIEVDESRCLIYFLAVADTPLESHIYVTSYALPGMKPIRLTELGYSYGVPREKKCMAFNDDLSVMATFRSNVTCPGECIVYSFSFPECANSSDVSIPRVKNHLLLKLPSREEGDNLASQESSTSSGNEAVYAFPSKKLFADDLLQDLKLLHSIPPRPLITEVVSKNFKLYSYLYRPFDWKQGQVLPTIVYIYGGPGFQLVRNSWTRHIFLTMYLNLGYAVVMTDGRGSLNRGGEFETAISGRLGCVEVEDQVNALLRIKHVHGTIDLSRVALMGWSYGGYLALMGLAQYPSAFKVAIAGAPVTDWRFYDTAYTERYMGLPENNQEAYGESSVSHLVTKFPSMAGRLLILHGMRDENVHFKHTSTLIQALIEAGKPYSLQTYPDERHAFRNAAATSHMFATILSFLDANL
ncbi:Peptidase S9 and DPPIV N domain containing protei n [Trichuris trichiura]|uniref:Peptidase S9 and DPPIV N domain containing protei n n=1 Tax=Trichuris trichiura TaxID=36087 RepID=A0A077Z4Z6_TRITR|nr:Peptidase S9 and DPPIV N domain containing protei n [Trichuris trichiura]